MTTQEPLTTQERVLRDRLQGELVPPRTPDRLVYAVDRLAHDRIELAPRGRWRALLDSGARRRARASIAIAAVVVIAGGTLLMGSVLQDRSRVAATPLPTLPAITQPSLPPAAASPTQIVSGRWFDANSAYVVEGTDALGRTGAILVTSDGGQTWKQSGWLQGGNAVDNGFDMLDAAHGYVGRFDAVPTGVSLSVNLTVDGGGTWRRQAIGSVVSPAIGAAYADVHGDTYAEVHFSDLQHGVALATLMTPWPQGSTPVPCPTAGTNGLGQACTSVPLACAGFATSDGGTTWSTLANAPCHVGLTIWSTPRLGEQASPDTSDVSTTVDGGVTWHAAALPGLEKGTSFLSSARVLTAVTGQTLRLAGVLSVLGAGPQPLSVWESSDAGATWRLAYQATPPSTGSASGQTSAAGAISDMWAFSADHWIAIVPFDGPSNTRGGLLETWDAGRSWTMVAPQQIGSGGWTWADRLHGMTDGGSWVCSSDNSCSRQRTWLLTNDGGQTWHGLPF